MLGIRIGFRIAWPLALLLSAMSACSSSYCAEPEHEADAMCQSNQGGTVAAFTVMPSRVTLNKDSSTALTVSAYSKLFNKPVTLMQSGGTAKPIMLGVVSSDGTLKATIKASDLHAQGYVPGAADIEVAGQKRRIRIYIAPQFDGTTFSAVHSVVGDHGASYMAAPTWVGVHASLKKILTLNEYSISTIAKQAIGEYSYDAMNKNINKFTPLLFSAYNSTPQMDMAWHSIALSATDILIPEYGNATVSLLTQCSLDGVCASSAVPYGSIASLSASLAGKLYAGIFNGKVLAFGDAGLNTGIAIDNSPGSSAAPAFLTLADVNEDARPDLAVWHRDGSISVAVSNGMDDRLTYDAKPATVLKALEILGNAPPDAVAAADIDFDGLEDMIIIKGSSLYLLSNQGGGSYLAEPPLTIPSQGPVGSAMLTPVSAITIADVSADDAGFKDLILVSKQNRLIAVMENTATVR